MLVDLHAYSNLSGGKPLVDLVEAARAEKIDAVCVVDRERSSETARAVADGNIDFPVFVGVEIATRSGDVLLFPRELDPALTREEWRELNALERPDLADVADWAARHDAVVLLAHPYDRGRRAAPRDRMFTLESVSGVEVGTDDSDPTANRVALEAVGRSDRPGFGGSARQRGAGDGSWLTLFANAVETQSDLVDAISGGDFWAVQLDRSDAPPRRPRRDGEERSGGRRDGGRRDGGRRDGGRGERRGGGGGGRGGRGGRRR